MGCAVGANKIRINTTKLIKLDCNLSNLDTISKNPENNNSLKSQKRSTLKEILKLAEQSKDMIIKNVSTLINSKPEENYFVISKLGNGAFGSVYKVKHKRTGKIRAMKIINKNKIIDEDQLINQKFLKEIEVLKI